MSKKSRRQQYAAEDWYPSSIEDTIEEMLDHKESVRNVMRKYGVKSIYFETDEGGYYF